MNCAFRQSAGAPEPLPLALLGLAGMAPARRRKQK
jgi:MYXO-CTERM domain-containing protein